MLLPRGFYSVENESISLELSSLGNLGSSSLIVIMAFTIGMISREAREH